MEFLPTFNTPAVGVGGLLSLFASQPQYIIKAESGDLAFTSMLEMGVEESTNLPTEPIEQGSFAGYNRVIEPLAINCRLATQGAPAELQDMLDKLRDLKTGFEKISFVVPMDSYDNLMLESFDYRRDQHSGHNLLTVDLRLKEIREIEGQKTTASVTEPEPPPVAADSTADGSCASAADCGEVQTYSPTAAETASAGDSTGGGGAKRSVARDIGDWIRGG
jgi:hypothetical protein